MEGKHTRPVEDLTMEVSWKGGEGGRELARDSNHITQHQVGVSGGVEAALRAL